MYEGPAALRGYWPEFRYELVDLSLHSQTEIKGELLLRVILGVMRNIHSGELDTRLPEIVALLSDLADRETALECLAAVLRYVAGASDKVTTADLERAAAAALPVAGGEVMPTLAEQWIEEGRQEGRQEGRKEGRKEGLEQGLLKGTRRGLLAGMGPALELKFGSDGVALLSELHEIEDVDVLRKVADAIRTARTVEDLRRLCH